MRSLVWRLLAPALVLGAAAPLVRCAPAPDEDDVAISGVNNALGLSLRLDQATGSVQATLKDELGSGEKLYLRVRAGKMTLGGAKDLDCAQLSQAKALTGAGRHDLDGKSVYQGPKVEQTIWNLATLFDDERWATGNVPANVHALAKQPDPIVEACIMDGSRVRAKLQVNLAYAIDVGTRDKARLHGGLGTRAVDAGAGEAAPEGDAGGGMAGIGEDNVTSQIEYGQLCEHELGRIPFFPMIRAGEYETFDCRDLVANGANGPHDVPGVEGAGIPATVDGAAVAKCSEGRELGPDSQSYECLDKADHGMFLASGGTQPGPMVVTAKNDIGTHWVLLCRKVADDGKGMMKTKKFNAVAMIGHNPRTGRTCFFQNSIGSGTDGSHVPHPGDVTKSTSMWSSYVQSYCSGSCHGNSPFVHSPWIDGAKRANGKPIVPMIGTLPDLPISNPEAPYNIVAADKLGFSLPEILVSEDAAACTNCHTLAKGSTLGNFTNWSTGTGSEYFGKITDYGKKFEISHWMPLNLDGVTDQTWATSKYGRALDFIKKCDQNASGPTCEWANSPRGYVQNPRLP